MAKQLPYFGKSFAVDDAREFVKMQMKKNQARDTATEHTRSQMARAAAAPEIARQTLLAQGGAMLENARRYTDAGYGVSGRGPTTGGAATQSKASEAFKKGLLEGGITDPMHLAVAMGYAEAESQFDVNAKGDPDKVTGAPTAFGIFQWRHGRFHNLQAFAQSLGKNWLDPYVQGRYAAKELVEGKESYAGRLLDTKTLDEAHRAMLGHIRPRDWQKGLSVAAGGPARKANTDAWLKTLANIKPDTTPGEAEPAPLEQDPATGRYIIRHLPSTVKSFTDFDDRDVGTFLPVPGGTPDKHGRIPYYWTPPGQVPGAHPNAPSAPAMPVTPVKADPTATPGAVPAVPTPAPDPTRTAGIPVAPQIPGVPVQPAMPQPTIPGIPPVPGSIPVPSVVPPPIPGDDALIDPFTGQPFRS